MSLLINGMDMPESCRYCKFCIAEDTNDDYSPYYCVINPYLRWPTSADILYYVPLGCKISEIPAPHGRLIDADMLMDLLEKSVPEKNRGRQFYMFRHILRNAPTVIETED